MEICLVGSILRHTIHSDAGVYYGWGGMTESAVAPFAAILKPGSKLHFVGSVGKEDLKEIKEFFQNNYPFVNTDSIHINPTGTDHHDGTKHRVQRRVQVTPTTYSHIAPYLKNADVVIFNFGNIDDIDPEAIIKTKKNTQAFVYVDVHRKPFGADKDGYMYVRGWDGWEKYLAHADAVQMDKNECEALLDRALLSNDDVINAAKKILDAGPREVFITLGERGILVGKRRENSDTHNYFHLPAVKCDVVDTTGSGDAFAAGYLVSRHEGKTLLDAVRFGITLAAINCEFKGYMKGITRDHISSRIPK